MTDIAEQMTDVYVQIICLLEIRIQVLLTLLSDNKGITLSRATCDKLHVTPHDDRGMTCVITSAGNIIRIIRSKVKVTS